MRRSISVFVLLALTAAPVLARSKDVGSVNGDLGCSISFFAGDDGVVLVSEVPNDGDDVDATVGLTSGQMSQFRRALLRAWGVRSSYGSDESGMILKIVSDNSILMVAISGGDLAIAVQEGGLTRCCFVKARRTLDAILWKLDEALRYSGGRRDSAPRPATRPAPGLPSESLPEPSYPTHGG